ncbi:ABC transporter permease [Halosimplex pelagicum]|uniref:ABC transporter permease n=1 Tax=Halosimplex pelagicum TaxID=869886 RepID=A0A7D5T5T6_9EURY|nr:ABC transporter permease [Halosimplex pelagicum]QLH83651.1 ABC transporter permease [Halosimplex pelagicum]
MNYYIRRFAQAIVTFVVGMFITFALYRLVPGGPVQAIIADRVQTMQQRGQPVDTQEVAEMAEQLTGINPDTPIPIAFYEWLRDIILYQDFGESILFQDPVFDILFRGMPWSIFLSVYGLLLGFTATIAVGVFMAWHEGTKIDSGLTVFVLVMRSIPYYVAAIVMLSVLAFQWGLFPTGGRAPPAATPGFNVEYMIGIARHATLPILSNFIVGFAGGAIGMRALSVRVIGEDYLRSARLRGLGTNRILTRYLTRNSILPIYTGFMLGIAGMFSSNVITEVIFQYHGVGWFMLEAAVSQDYPLVMAAFVFFSGITVTAILIADLTYGLIDPRAGTGASRESF